MELNPIDAIIDILLNAKVNHPDEYKEHNEDFTDLFSYILKLKYKYIMTDNLNENIPPGEVFKLASKCILDNTKQCETSPSELVNFAQAIRTSFQVFNEVLEWHPFLKTYNPILTHNLALLFNKLS
jgi:hypothetical protein